MFSYLLWIEWRRWRVRTPLLRWLSHRDCSEPATTQSLHKMLMQNCVPYMYCQNMRKTKGIEGQFSSTFCDNFGGKLWTVLCGGFPSRNCFLTHTLSGEFLPQKRVPHLPVRYEWPPGLPAVRGERIVRRGHHAAVAEQVDRLLRHFFALHGEFVLCLGKRRKTIESKCMQIYILHFCVHHIVY